MVSTHDRPERIATCLPSLLALHYPRYEVIIVDNAPSTTATAELIQQTYRDVARVRYIREDRPGLSWGRNCGMMAASGEILAITDDDVVVDPYWLVELVRAFSLAEDVACVTGLVLPLELETPAQFWFEERGGGFSKGFTRRIFDMEGRHVHLYKAGLFGSGACMAFTAAFLRSAGGFDPALGAGTPARSAEETATFFQVITQGHKLVYQPAALLYHPSYRDYVSLRKQVYGYGVGLTAYLTKSLLDNPRLLVDFVTKVPYGLFSSLSSRSSKNSKKSAHFPKELTRLERKGMLYGPFAYLQSRWALRKARKAFAPVETYPTLP
ncbi:MAG: glycosyltransferase, partial [Ktedonobacteraceae bacterium]